MAAYDYLEIGHAPDVKDPSERRWYRFFEIIPGALAWVTLITIVVLAFWAPVFAALFIIAFDIYWLVKTIYLSVHMNASFRAMRANQKRDWGREVAAVRAQASELGGIGADDLYHMVILPFYKEPKRIVREAVVSLLRANWSNRRMIVVLTAEERGGPESHQTALDIEKEFGSQFVKFIATQHPDGLPGELRGKGSNERWAGKKGRQAVDELGIPHERVIVSVFDVDTMVPSDFFA